MLPPKILNTEAFSLKQERENVVTYIFRQGRLPGVRGGSHNKLKLFVIVQNVSFGAHMRTLSEHEYRAPSPSLLPILHLVDPLCAQFSSSFHEIWGRSHYYQHKETVCLLPHPQPNERNLRLL